MLFCRPLSYPTISNLLNASRSKPFSIKQARDLSWFWRPSVGIQQQLLQAQRHDRVHIGFMLGLWGLPIVSIIVPCWGYLQDPKYIFG